MSGQPRSTVVLKFGGSVLTNPEACRIAVHEVYRHFRAGIGVVAVCSAFKGETDSLAQVAELLSDQIHEEATAALLRTGELQSAACLAIACDAAGLPVTLLGPERIKLTTTGPLLDADPAEVDVSVIHGALDRGQAVVVPGFVGRDLDGRVSVLGRGGSDLTALFLAAALGARCRLVKDVRGWYDADRALRQLNVEDVRLHEDTVIQKKAVVFAAQSQTTFGLGKPGDAYETTIGRETSTNEDLAADLPPLRVAIAGVGTVGSGAWRHFVDSPTDFIVVGGLVADLRKARPAWIDTTLLTNQRDALPPCDLLIDALPDAESAADVVAGSLRKGVHVVSANKDLIAQYGYELSGLARAAGAEFYYSAAVGGACPVLETASRLTRRGKVVRVRGILNATANVVLDSLGGGLSLVDAVTDAQERGFAEADPTSDLDGRDAANKVVLLCHALTGDWLSVDEVTTRPFDAENLTGGRVRQVAELVLDYAEPPDRRKHVASVTLQSIEGDDVLAGIEGDWNAAAFEIDNGTIFLVTGRGAGRWPTAESIVADAFSLRRSLATHKIYAEVS